MIKFTPFLKTTVNKKVKNVCNGENENEKKRLAKLFFNETCMASLIFCFQFVGCDRSESKATVVVKGKRRLGSQCPTVLSGGKTVVDNCWQLLIIVDNC